MAKEYKINSAKRYKVTFAKDGAAYKAGDTATMNIVIAAKMFRQGKIEEIPADMEADIKKYGLEELFAANKKRK